ncbi:Uncharacterised protein r2_g2105 [Pycnogonum litorale]
MPRRFFHDGIATNLKKAITSFKSGNLVKYLKYSGTSLESQAPVRMKFFELRKQANIELKSWVFRSMGQVLRIKHCPTVLATSTTSATCFLFNVTVGHRHNTIHI